ncbi:MAG: toxin-antitoxin system HicB family antitoxin [Deltaproteobacteria bacterium]|nr:toxin-antitoxin system HicB family antitoxin [Deltaproteobacteria bacterium]
MFSISFRAFSNRAVRPDCFCCPKTNLRQEESLAAAADGVSLNQWIAQTVREDVRG